jgi:hypothetical protein
MRAKDFAKKRAQERKAPPVNAWLHDPIFFDDLPNGKKPYYRRLFRQLKKFISGCPRPVVLTFRPRYNALTVRIHESSFYIHFTEQTRFRDLLEDMTQKLKHLYPFYELETGEIEIPLSADEIVEETRKGVPVETLLSAKKKVPCKERGTILCIWMNDRFHLEIQKTGSERIVQLRLATKPVLSFFLEELKEIKEHDERKKFIMENSLLLEESVSPVLPKMQKKIQVRRKKPRP